MTEDARDSSVAPEPPATRPQLKATVGVAHLEGGQAAGFVIEKARDIDVHSTVNVLGMNREQMEAFADLITARLGLKDLALKELVRQPVSEAAREAIAQAIAAEKQIAAEGQTVSAKTLYSLGRMALHARNWDEALAYFRQATEADPELSDAFEDIAWLQQSRAMVDYQQQDYDAAMAKLKEAYQAGLHTDPFDPRALALTGFVSKSLAQVAAALGDRDEEQRHLLQAARYFEQATLRDPGDLSAQHGLGNVQHHLGHLDEAIAAYEKVVAARPDHAFAQHDLALAYEQKIKTDPDQASLWCERALQAWCVAYALFQEGRGPTAETDRLVALAQIRKLEAQCGEPGAKQACRNCQAELPPDARFCPNCGVPVGA